MINHNAQNSSYFLKYIIWFVIYVFGLKIEIQQACMIWSMVRSTRDHFFFLKKKILKTVSVTIIANSEKMRMKKIRLSMAFAFPLPSSFWFPQHTPFKMLPQPNFLEISFLPFKKRGGTGRGQRTMCIHLKSYIIFHPFCVFLLENFDVYYSRPCLIWLSAKIFRTSIFMTK